MNNSGLYNFAGGKVDNKEKGKAAAIREGFEEVGIKIDKAHVKKIATLTPRGSKMSFYLYRDMGYPVVHHNEEVDSFVWVQPQRLNAYPLHRPTYLFVSKYLKLLRKPRDE